MRDQASDLRHLVRIDLAQNRYSGDADDATPPRLVVVAGGKGGVGTTTVALHLAMAMARDGQRTVLVDADFNGADATKLCQVEPRQTVLDVLEDRATVHEALLAGPEGVQLLPGDWSQRTTLEYAAPAQQRLMTELRKLGAFADCIVVDAGNGLNQSVKRFWMAADTVVLVTTSDLVSVMDAYAAVKVLGIDSPRTPIWTIVNQVGADGDDPDLVGRDVFERLERACQRFLALHVHDAGYVRQGSLPVEGQKWEKVGQAASKCFAELAQSLVAGASEPPPVARAILPLVRST